MKIKMIALDLDDTLLDEQIKITSRCENAVKKAASMGIQVILATGRNYICTKQYLRQLELAAPVITNGGAEVYDERGELIRSRYLTAEMAKEIIGFAVAEGVHFQIYRDDCFCYEKEDEYCALYSSFNGLKGMEIPDLRNRSHDTPKLLIIDREEKILELRKKAEKTFGSKYNISISKPWYLEFNRPDASKGAALRYLAEMYGLERENIMAVGDGQIDLSMIEYAGLGIAMANGWDTILERADFITASNQEDGVAKAIEKFVIGS